MKPTLSIPLLILEKSRELPLSKRSGFIYELSFLLLNNLILVLTEDQEEKTRSDIESLSPALLETFRKNGE